VPDESAFDHHIGGKRDARRRERALSELARRQLGVVARSQLVGLGFGRRAIDLRLDRARLVPVYRGVYSVGHPPLSAEARWMAAVLAAGPGAVLSHRSAAALWGILPPARSRPSVTRALHSRPRIGLEIHRSRIPSDEVAECRGIPVTSVPRTLLDLAAVLDRRQLERAVNEAEVMRLLGARSLADLLARYPRRHGVAAVRELLAERAPAQFTRSELEARFQTFLADVGLPRPQLNAAVEAGDRRFECDCVWRSHLVIAELDGRAFHATAAAFERDRERDRILESWGWRVVRVTWRQLQRDSRALAADLGRMLGRGREVRPRR
jgi:hypothetical protein